LQPSLVRTFNELRFRSTPRRGRDQVESFGAHMFPLDGLSAWPRLYGPQGFIQYQLVLPRGQETALHNLLVTLRRSPVPCYLAVLKDFGPANSSPLSFPLQGWTLTLDMPRSAPGLAPLLRRFDDLLLGAGGRVYLAKDDRVAPDVLAAMYPRLDEWRAVRDRVDPDRLWASDLALRTDLLGAA
jgi:decaprenylphospho-beta-D-ribofuranose 2-oxidase